MSVLLLFGCGAGGGPVHLAPVDSAPTVDAGPDLAGAVGVAIPFAGGGEAAGFTWSFGDGTSAEGAEVTHAYAEPGNYVAVLAATGADGSTRTDSARVSVYPEPAAEPPAWSSPMALVYGRVWVVNPEAGTVAVIAGGERIAEMEACAHPRTLAHDLGVVAVACEDDAELARFDALTMERQAPVALPRDSRPYGVAGRGGTFWVSLAGTGEVAEVRETEVVRHAVGADPRAVAVGVDGTVWVSRFRSAPDHGELYRLGGEPVSLALHPGPDSDTVMGGIPNLIEALVVSPDGGMLYAGGLQANVGRGLYLRGEPLTFESTVRAALVPLALPAAVEDLARRKQLDNHDRVSAAAFGPWGNYLYLAHPGTGAIQVVDRYTLDLAGSLPDAGEGLIALAWEEDVLYAYAWLDREVRAWDHALPGDVPRARWAVSTVEAEPLDPEVLAGKRLFYDSGDTRIAKDGYIACASCHLDGRDDGMTWDFTDRGEGLRNTISLVGRAGVGMGPLHWSANFDEVQDFENDMRNAFGGRGFLSDADWAEAGATLGPAKAGRSPELDALAAYVSSLDTPPPSPWETTEGADTFLALGCDSCHPAPAYTDSSLATFTRHNVGTLTAASGGRKGAALDGLDTPSLLGTWQSAPYLHDGSAPTLEAAIEAHGPISQADLAAVAAFVRGL